MTVTCNLLGTIHFYLHLCAGLFAAHNINNNIHLPILRHHSSALISILTCLSVIVLYSHVNTKITKASIVQLVHITL